MHLNFFTRPKALCKAVSVIAILGLVAGSFSGLLFSRTAEANNGLFVSAVPNTGTLGVGDTLEVHFGDPSNTTTATSPSCTVNGVDVTGTFQNVSPGDYKVTYTVGSGDANRSAGTIPINCTLSEGASVTVTAFDDGNTVAIDTTGGGTAALAISELSVSPNTGTVTAGDLIEVSIREANGTADLAVGGTCHVNGIDATASFQNLSGGLYKLSYTVGAGDGERPAGNIPVSCTLSNSSGSVTTSGWTDGNTLSIDTNGDGSIDNGTNNLGFTVTADPSTGTLEVGQSLQVYMQDPLPSGDVVIGSAGCRVNDVDVSGSYTYQGNGLYRVTYTVGSGDAERGAGLIPFDCTLQNNTGSVHLVEFTDGNTVAVNVASGGGNTGTTTEAALAFTVGAVPSVGTLEAGGVLEVYLEETNGNQKIELGGACRVNEVDVAGTFQDLSGGLYKITYTVGSGDAERAAGTIPISCAVRDWYTGSSTVLTSFTDSNTVAIDANGDGTVTPPTGGTVGFISTVYSNPTSGTLGVGGQLEVFIQEGNNDPDYTVQSCTVNNVDVAGTYANMGNGLYKFTYTVGAGDANRSAGQIPISCVLRDNVGQTITASVFTNVNTVAINIESNNTGTTTNNTGTTSTTTGDISGNVTSTTSLSVTSVTQVESVAVAGGGYEDGWVWVFNITVPSDEEFLQAKFNNWTGPGGATISVANNMRISSNQATSSSPVTITAAGTYSQALTLSGDLDSSASGRQIQLRVEMQVPSGTTNGNYSTSYGIRSFE